MTEDETIDENKQEKVTSQFFSFWYKKKKIETTLQDRR